MAEDRDEHPAEHELPDVSKNQSSDEVRGKEAGTKEILAFDAACQQVREPEGDEVDGDHRNAGIDDGAAHGIPERPIGEH